MSTPTATDRRSRWGTVRHYAYMARPFDAALAMLAEAPYEVLGAERTTDEGTASAPLTARRGVVKISRTVTIRFGSLVCDDDMARMVLRWQDSRHAYFFPVFEGILSLAPIEAGRYQVTQVGLVGRYRPPLGAAGAAADRVAGNEVAEEVIGAFVDAVTARLEALIPPETVGARRTEVVEKAGVPSGHSRILVTLDGLAGRRGGAVGVTRQLAGTPGVTHAEVNPLAGIATIEYDPESCSLSRILAELEVGSPDS